MHRVTIVLVAIQLAVGAVVTAATHYVDVYSDNPVSPYVTWETAASDIQSAVDVAVAGDEIVVADGTYMLQSEICVTNDISIVSTNGAHHTTIDAQNLCRAFNLTNAACVVSGFRIINGYTMLNGGAILCTDNTPAITKCVFYNNRANIGGAVEAGSVSNSVFVNNSAVSGGGALSDSIVYNSVMTRNSAVIGGALANSQLYSCTVTRNSATTKAGGTDSCFAYNSIIYYNTAPSDPDILNTYIENCDTPTAQPSDTQCISDPPKLASSSNLASDSPCIRGGNASYLKGFDIDNEHWDSYAAMGCDAYYSTPQAATPQQYFELWLDAGSALAVGQTGSVICVVVGNTSHFEIDFGDGVVATNELEATHVWTTPGTYEITLTAWNPYYPQGYSISNQVEVFNRIIYVSTAGSDSNDGFSWITAKRSIPAATSVAVDGNMVLVSNGLYQSAEIIVTNDIALCSVNGYSQTIIDGWDMHRCLNLGGHNCIVKGFTIEKGAVTGHEYGGGVCCSNSVPQISDCLITGCRADSSYGAGGGIYQGTVVNCCVQSNSAAFGGGIYHGVARNCNMSWNSANLGGGAVSGGTNICCVITNNTSGSSGGGAYYGNLKDCLVAGNQANSGGGGIYLSYAVNCTIADNSSNHGPGGCGDSSLENCIVWYNTTNNISDGTVLATCSPDVTDGDNGCITNAPIFVNRTNGNYHLSAASPCIDTGHNALAAHGAGCDIDAVPRPLDGDKSGSATADMGCYEYVCTDRDADSDCDGLSDADERVAGTNPFGSNSLLKVTVRNSSSGSVISWTPESDRTYSILTTNALGGGFVTLFTGMDYPISSWTDTASSVKSPRFYKIKVEQK